MLLSGCLAGLSLSLGQFQQTPLPISLSATARFTIGKLHLGSSGPLQILPASLWSSWSEAIYIILYCVEKVHIHMVPFERPKLSLGSSISGLMHLSLALLQQCYCLLFQTPTHLMCYLIAFYVIYHRPVSDHRIAVPRHHWVAGQCKGIELSAM